MIYVHKNENGEIVAIFANPQPSATDCEGNIICDGISTEAVDENDPAVAAAIQQMENRAAIRKQIEDLQQQFTTTMQMGVVLNIQEDIDATTALYSQIEALKQQL